MCLGWDEIKRRAKAFSEEWQDAHYEKGETQTFYNEFFDIFGIRRRQVAIYEQRVKLLNDRHGFIDQFWPGTLLVEQKSSRLDLGKAQGQALDYVEGSCAIRQCLIAVRRDLWIACARDLVCSPNVPRLNRG
jgi:hypothetical protein